MTLAAAPHPEDSRLVAEFVIEDITTGVFASGFGHLGDGRTFSFRVHRGQLLVEIYRPRLAGPVPVPEDVVAGASRSLTDLDVDDARSLSAAVRDAIAEAAPVPRPGR
jgi:hypothetical protein